MSHITRSALKRLLRDFDDDFDNEVILDPAMDFGAGSTARRTRPSETPSTSNVCMLDLLPDDMLDLILQEISSRDLISARLVCRDFARVCRGVWIRKSHGTNLDRHAAFTFPSPLSLKMLSEMLKPAEWRVLPELIRTIHLDIYPSKGPEGHRDGNALHEHADHFRNFKSALHNGSGRAQFLETLAALPHLVALHIAPWFVSDSFESRRLRVRGYRDGEDQSSTYDQLLKHVLPAFGQVPLQTLSIVADQRFFDSLSMNDLTSAFTNTSAARYSIKTMTLTLTHSSGRDTFANADYDCADKVSAFLSCFENLETLTIDTLYSPSRGVHNILHSQHFNPVNRKWLHTVLNGKESLGVPTLGYITQVPHWKKLKSLIVKHFTFGTSDMLFFLKRHASSLKSVKLSYCGTDSFEDVIPFADTLRNDLKFCDSVMNIYLVKDGRWGIV